MAGLPPKSKSHTGTAGGRVAVTTSRCFPIWSGRCGDVRSRQGLCGPAAGSTPCA